MAGSERSLCEDITAAQRQLDAARIDGAADKIQFWARRVNELLDQYSDAKRSR